MLIQEEVDKEEELLRARVNKLNDADRKSFFSKVKKSIKDPDTYATLNWFFVTGLHHFYLGKWLRGTFNLLVFILGVVLILINIQIGWFFILFISIIELWALFRSQIIIQDWNNKIYRQFLNEFENDEKLG